MYQIWKFPLAISDYQILDVSADAQLLTVQMQRDVPCLWVLADLTKPFVKRAISVRGTGRNILVPGKYIATFQSSHNIVFHVFDQGELP